MLKKIQLKTQVLINGKVAHPNDENKGIYEVHKYVASSLVARKRAVFVDEDIKNASNNAPSQNNNIELTLEEAKIIADELGIKYSPQIGVKNLLKKIDEELEIQAKEYNLEIEEISIKEAMELYRKAKGANGGDKDDAELLEKLKVLAEEIEIEYEEDATAQALKEILEMELEKYASEQQLEVPENADIFQTWELIKEKLQNG